jgi:ParB/RepB/Spo0J family partition protein
MKNRIVSIAVAKLAAHPDNPNRMSDGNFAKLVRNIERSGLYEPLLVRPDPNNAGHFQLIHGHSRLLALKKLGCEKADCIVRDIDDEQADILLATLNRLGGRDRLEQKLALLRRLNSKIKTTELSGVLPYNRGQLERLVSLTKPPTVRIPAILSAKWPANPMVFFVNDSQQEIISKALSQAAKGGVETTSASKNASALAVLARQFLAVRQAEEGD